MTSRKCEHIRSYYLAMVTACVSLFLVASSLVLAVCNAVSVPVIASGGAGKIEDFITLFQTLPRVDAGLAASIFHFGEVKISDLKAEMQKNGIPARL